MRADFDMETAPSLKALPLPLWPRRVEMNPADVTFIGSSGVNLLLAHHRHCREAGSRLLVVHPSKTVEQIIRLLGVQELLMDEGEDEANRERWGDPPDPP